MGLPNYARFITGVAANRQPSLIRELTKVLASAPKEMIPLSGGFPNPAMFPFVKTVIETIDGQTISLEGQELQKALQYLPTQGLPALVNWLKDLQKEVHHPPLTTDLIVTCGSQDGLCKAIEMLLSPGDSVVVEDYIYAGTLGIMNPYKPNYIIVEGDRHGIKPDILRQKLNQATEKPKFMYLNPTGANPTGTILPEDRRREIYSLAVEHDMLIIEDDPYYYLQFSTSTRPPSFLSIDVEGRVLRFDSFSKVLSSGLRLGFVTGPPTLIDRINLHMQASVLHASSLSQVIASELLQRWGLKGFLQHVNAIETFYERRRDLMVAAADKHLTGLCEFSVPEGGMFLWLKVHNIEDTWDMLLKRGIEKNIMLLPGKGFMPGLSDNSKCNYMRAAFSVAAEEDFDVAFARLAQLIKDEQKI